MSEHNAVVGIYNSHTDAEAAVKELKKSFYSGSWSRHCLRPAGGLARWGAGRRPWWWAG